MLQLKDFMPVNFLKKEKYTGSCKGMRFRMEKFEKEGEETPVLRVNVWPELYSFDCFFCFYVRTVSTKRCIANVRYRRAMRLFAFYVKV